jgi:hypothetical protein
MLYCIIKAGVEAPYTPDETYAVIPAATGWDFLALADAFLTLRRQHPAAVRLEVVTRPVRFYSGLPSQVLELLLSTAPDTPAQVEANYAFVEFAPEVLDDIPVHACDETTGMLCCFVDNYSAEVQPEIHVAWIGVPKGCMRRHQTHPVPLKVWDQVLRNGLTSSTCRTRTEAIRSLAYNPQHQTGKKNLVV